LTKIEHFGIEEREKQKAYFASQLEDRHGRKFLFSLFFAPPTRPSSCTAARVEFDDILVTVVLGFPRMIKSV
jgi:hypothetical protein